MCVTLAPISWVLVLLSRTWMKQRFRWTESCEALAQQFSAVLNLMLNFQWGKFEEQLIVRPPTPPENLMPSWIWMKIGGSGQQARKLTRKKFLHWHHQRHPRIAVSIAWISQPFFHLENYNMKIPSGKPVWMKKNLFIRQKLLQSVAEKFHSRAFHAEFPSYKN